MSLFGLSGSPSRNSVHLLVKGQRSLYKQVSAYHNIGKYRELLFLQRRNNWDGSAQRCRTQRTPFINCAMDASYGNASDDSADDEAERKKKKKMKSVGEQVKLTPGSHLGYGFEPVDHVKKTTAVFKPATGIAQTERLDASKENVTVDLKEDERFPNRKSSSAKLKAKKKIEIEHLGLLNKKVKILGEGIKATLLHHVDDLLKSIEKQLNGANELVEDLEISIRPIHKELNELQGKIKSMEEVEEISQQVQLLKKKLAWAHVYDVDNQLQQESARIEKLKDRIRYCQDLIDRQLGQVRGTTCFHNLKGDVVVCILCLGIGNGAIAA